LTHFVHVKIYAHVFLRQLLSACVLPRMLYTFRLFFSSWNWLPVDVSILGMLIYRSVLFYPTNSSIYIILLYNNSILSMLHAVLRNLQMRFRYEIPCICDGQSVAAGKIWKSEKSSAISFLVAVLHPHSEEFPYCGDNYHLTGTTRRNKLQEHTET
jgi:hypothetical protein